MAAPDHAEPRRVWPAGPDVMASSHSPTYSSCSPSRPASSAEGGRAGRRVMRRIPHLRHWLLLPPLSGKLSVHPGHVHADLRNYLGNSTRRLAMAPIRATAS